MPVENNHEISFLFTVFFGADQEKIIDHLLKEMITENRVYSYKKTYLPKELLIKYEILMQNVFQVYQMGFRQGQLSSEKVMKILSS